MRLVLFATSSSAINTICECIWRLIKMFGKYILIAILVYDRITHYFELILSGMHAVYAHTCHEAKTHCANMSRIATQALRAPATQRRSASVLVHRRPSHKPLKCNDIINSSRRSHDNRRPHNHNRSLRPPNQRPLHKIFTSKAKLPTICR